MVKKIAQYLIKRLTEANTWIAIVVAVAAYFGKELTDAQALQLASAIAQVIAAIVAILPAEIWGKLLK